MHMVTFVEALIFPCATGTHACPFGSQYPKVSQRGLVVFFRKERTWRGGEGAGSGGRPGSPLSPSLTDPQNQGCHSTSLRIIF